MKTVPLECLPLGQGVGADKTQRSKAHPALDLPSGLFSLGVFLTVCGSFFPSFLFLPCRHKVFLFHLEEPHANYRTHQHPNSPPAFRTKAPGLWDSCSFPPPWKGRATEPRETHVGKGENLAPRSKDTQNQALCSNSPHKSQL